MSVAHEPLRLLIAIVYLDMAASSLHEDLTYHWSVRGMDRALTTSGKIGELSGFWSGVGMVWSCVNCPTG